MNMHRTPWLLALVCSAAGAAPAVDYDIRATTDTGLMAAMPSFANLLRGITKPRGDYVYTLKLEMNGNPQPDGATHSLPDGMKMSSPLQLLAPQRLDPMTGNGDSGSRKDSDSDSQPQQPKGRLVLYWGCNADSAANQPKIIDFANMTPADMLAFSKNILPLTQRMMPSGLFGQPQLGTALKWPNAQYTTDVPLDASLVGTHTVKAFNGPQFDLDISADQDFLAPLKLKQDGNGLVTWDAIPRATGYFGLAFGRGEQQNDMVIWTSSAKPVSGGQLADYQSPSDAAADIAKQTVLDPATTQCNIPAALLKNNGKPLIFWVAYGPEKIQSGTSNGKSWRAHLRVKATAMLLPGAQGAMGGARGGNAANGSDARAYTAQNGTTDSSTSSNGRDASSQATPSAKDMMIDKVKGKLKGMFGL